MKIKTFSLAIPGRIEVTLLNYGGIIQKLLVPGKNGMTDVVLGFDDPEDYKKDHPYFGALIGRFANRIAGGKFECAGKTFELVKNHGDHSLHGGLIGFDRVIWDVERRDDYSCTLRHFSPDGHEGYPGNLEVEVTYEIRSEGELILTYRAKTDMKTPINLTNHSYFNLSGAGEKIQNHKLWINADHLTEIDDDLIPTGAIVPVNGKSDFRILKNISSEFDHNFVLNEAPLSVPKARLINETSRIMMELFTTEPGLQFYTGNFLDGTLQGKNGIRYSKHSGLCLETQHFPDSPHHANFPSTWLSLGETFHSETIYKFRNL